DDDLVAFAAQLRQFEKPSIVVSGDSGPYFSADQEGITCVDVVGYRFPEEPDPLVAENQRLKAELARLTSSLPDLSITITHPDGVAGPQAAVWGRLPTSGSHIQELARSFVGSTQLNRADNRLLHATKFA